MCRASDEGFPDASFHIYLNFVVSKDKGTWVPLCSPYFTLALSFTAPSCSQPIKAMLLLNPVTLCFLSSMSHPMVPLAWAPLIVKMSDCSPPGSGPWADRAAAHGNGNGDRIHVIGLSYVFCTFSNIFQ